MSKNPIKYFGGKSYLVKKLEPYVPEHNRRISPFFGGGSFELYLPSDNVSEVYNDIDNEIINFYSVLRDDFEAFSLLCNLTPFHEREFDRITGNNNLERAWRFFTDNRLSRGGDRKDFATHSSRLRRRMNENISAYLSAVDSLYDFHLRISKIEFRDMDYKDFLKKFDKKETFCYLDPPYLKETRIAGGYSVEPENSEEFHTNLLNFLPSLKCNFMLSSYPNELYSNFIKKYGWHLVEIPVKKHSSSKKNKPKTNEWIIMNYECN